MRLGWSISGVGHAALILVLLFGGLFRGDRIPEPVSVSTVTTISEEEFAALVLPGVQPDPQTEAPDAPPPESEEQAPETPAAQDAPTMPTQEEAPVAEAPDTSEIEVPQPLPDAVAVDTQPPVPVAPSEQDGTSLERDAVAAPAPRVATVPQVAPPPDAETAPEAVPDVAPEPSPEPLPEPEPEEPAAPEAASDRIVTEAEEVETYAPASSMRPRSRPPVPVRRAETPRAPEPEPDAQPERPSTDDAVAAALSNETPREEAPVRSGPPLTGGERDAFRVAVSRCWNVGSLSTDALATTVIVGVEMEQSGKPITGSIRLVDFTGGSQSGAQQAFEAARRAIIRCGANGFPLPVEKFAEWREIEMTFNPEGMQFR